MHKLVVTLEVGVANYEALLEFAGELDAVEVDCKLVKTDKPTTVRQPKITRHTRKKKGPKITEEIFKAIHANNDLGYGKSTIAMVKRCKTHKEYEAYRAQQAELTRKRIQTK